LFSGHATFFSNQDAQQTLITNVISLIESRGAHGVNMDVEALPSAYKEEFTSFMIDLCEQLHSEIPGGEVSIAAPAVNWSDKINIPVLNEYLDFYVVMGYDYYWSGSEVAGPVSPLYSMTSSYNYNYC
jgi:spore germination protein YaaH